MQYRPAMFFGLKTAKFGTRSGLVLHVDAIQMTAEARMDAEHGPNTTRAGQPGHPDVPLLGKEQRLNVALGYRTSVYWPRARLGP